MTAECAAFESPQKDFQQIFKMGIDRQFSMSVELTKLIPLTLAGIGKTYDAAMSLARDLQVCLQAICWSEILLRKCRAQAPILSLKKILQSCSGVRVSRLSLRGHSRQWYHDLRISGLYQVLLDFIVGLDQLSPVL